MNQSDTEALKALVELAKKAGAHEWAIDGDDRPGMEWNNFIVQADARHMTVCFMAHAEGDNSELEAAAEFIAAAKNAIPALKALLSGATEARAEQAAREISAAQYAYAHHNWDWKAVVIGISDGAHIEFAAAPRDEGRNHES